MKARTGRSYRLNQVSAPTHSVPLERENLIWVNLENIEKCALVDSGASVSLIDISLITQLSGFQINKIKPSEVTKAVLANKQCIPVIGQIDLDVMIGGKKFMVNFQVLPSMNYWMILGVDFLHKFQCKLDFKKKCLKLGEVTDRSDITHTDMGAVNVHYQTPAICNVEEAPTEPHDLAYYEKNAFPDFTQMSKPSARHLPPVPLDLTDSIFDNRQKSKLRDLIKKYRHVFAVDLGELEPNPNHTYHIQLRPDAIPPRARVYRTSPEDRKIIDEQIDQMLTYGVIEPTEGCEYTSPIVLAAKKDGTKRFCLDFRQINKVIRPDTYPLPLIADLMDAVGSSGAKCFSLLDMRSAFWQVALSKQSRKITSFLSHRGQHQFTVLPFGLTCSPSVFQRVINNALREYNWKFVLPYLSTVRPQKK